MMTYEDNLKITKKVQIIAFVLAAIVFIYGFFTAKAAGEQREYESEATKFELVTTDKINDKHNNYSVYCDFKCTVKNNSSKIATKVDGTFTIFDKDGNMLSTGTAYFSSSFDPGSETNFNLSWKMDKTDNAVEIWNTDFSDLRIEYVVQEVTFEDRYDPILINQPADSQ